MKKVFALVLALVMMFSVALADCACSVTPAMRKIADKLLETDVWMEPEELNAVSAISLGLTDTCYCEAFKSVLWYAMIEEQATMYMTFTDSQLLEIRAYMIHCGCMCAEIKNVPESTPLPTVTPGKPAHRHTGGNHSNGGKCQSCGVVYQTHTVEWKDVNNSFHEEHCTCGWTGEQQKHVVGEKMGKENGLTKFRCSVCGAIHYWYMSYEDYYGANNWCEECHRPVSQCCPTCQCGGCAG